LHGRRALKNEGKDVLDERRLWFRLVLEGVKKENS
jgi:hypothetical protein